MYHFISGLPRSGSTLLAAILRQNPAFHAGIMSPLGHMFSAAIDAMGPENEAFMQIEDIQRTSVLSSLFDRYYYFERKPIVFDTNRRWCAQIGSLGELFPSSKVIACIRPPAEIVDSFERVFQERPLSVSVITGSKSNQSVYERVEMLMRPTGVVGYAWNAFQTAFFGPHSERLVCVSYHDLCCYPGAVMEELHKEIGAEPFDYKFDEIQDIPGAEEFDLKLGTPGLHKLKSKVTYEPRRPLLPPDIWSALPQPFWNVKEEATPAA